MRKATLLLATFALIVSPYARAVIGTVDNVPAATVLYPYFEVDLADPNGINTELALTNASATAVLANIVIWSDRSVQVARFNVYLTGFDTQRINLRDVIVNGVIPRTATAGQDPTGTISPKGPASQDINYASCNGVLPLANFTPTELTSIQAALTGQSSSALGGCAGTPYGDSIARGYVTADAVSQCGGVHTDPFYHTSGLTNQNILLGDSTFTHPATGRAHTEIAVHVEASTTDTRVTTSGNYTFYGRYNGFTATDRREPIGAKWAATYIRNAGRAVAWRDTKQNQTAFPCNTTPAPFPLGHRILVSFGASGIPDHLDETESRPFPNEAGQVLLGSASFPVNHKFGWVYLNLDEATPGTNPPSDPGRRQSYVQMLLLPETFQSSSPFSFGFSAIQLETPLSGFQFADPSTP